MAILSFGKKLASGAVRGVASGGPVGAVEGVTGAVLGAIVGDKFGSRNKGKKRGHHRGLTQKRKNDLLWLKNNIGRTAAANYLANHNL